MWQRLEKTFGGHQDLVCAYASGALAAVLLRYIAGVRHPLYGHLLLALIALGGILAAYLLIAQANVEPDTKAANVIGAAIVGAICFALPYAV